MKLVLDTNVVLDWLLFRDSTLQPLGVAISQGRVSLVANARTLDELRRVLQYQKFELQARQQNLIFTQYADVAFPFTSDSDRSVVPQGFPHCRDPDDDHFVALAYCARADALISKDRQVLKLRKRAAKFGVSVLTLPELMQATALAAE